MTVAHLGMLTWHGGALGTPRSQSQEACEQSAVERWAIEREHERSHDDGILSCS
jgi:hypothetical protein